ncbi:hypothetical protein DFO70_111161 [Cytobacillus firmus]|uniref:ZIP Zinc transporter n=2 Tax=Cytobacillus TaxID=2675230 RepID=A0A366JQ19_CYTFI|nr:MULTISPECIES: hypothetical protein [Cytobacillus]RBP89508.1 hypothetical protein DFO70_111161 [Cytobacillus firmus]TDX47265.1 hypothetical protein DFO72_101356 [Cytobacillus oceanisediminis]
MFSLLSFIFALGFSFVHFSSKYMKFLTYIPRSRLLSAASGISVAYIFVHVLPELKKHQESLEGMERSEIFKYLDSHVYIFAMMGLCAFYGIEKAVKYSQKNKDERNAAKLFGLHISSFFIYNMLIGYLLVHGEFDSLKEWLIYFFALSVHFISNDHGLRQSHKRIYDKYGQWVLTFSILIGWAVGVLTEVSEMVIAFLFAALAGGVILNVLKEELPEERESNFAAFIGGVAGYTIILIMI